MVLVHGFAEISSLLLVPPVAMRVAELPLDPRRVDEAAVLPAQVSFPPTKQPCALWTASLTMFGSSASVSWGGSGYFSSMMDLSFIELGRKHRRWIMGSRRAACAADRRAGACAIRRGSIFESQYQYNCRYSSPIGTYRGHLRASMPAKLRCGWLCCSTS